MTKSDREQILKWVFSPTTPIKKEEVFEGRITQLEKICEAINTEGQHAILFGDRGVEDFTCKHYVGINYSYLSNKGYMW
jgi:hypothetical protein